MWKRRALVFAVGIALVVAVWAFSQVTGTVHKDEFIEVANPEEQVIQETEEDLFSNLRGVSITIWTFLEGDSTLDSAKAWTSLAGSEVQGLPALLTARSADPHCRKTRPEGRPSQGITDFAQVFVFGSSLHCQLAEIPDVSCLPEPCESFGCLAKVVANLTESNHFLFLPRRRPLQYQKILEAVRYLRRDPGNSFYRSKVKYGYVGYTRWSAENAKLAKLSSYGEWRDGILRETKAKRMSLFRETIPPALVPLARVASQLPALPAPPVRLSLARSPKEPGNIEEFVAHLNTTQLLVTLVTSWKQQGQYVMNWVCALQMVPDLPALVVTTDPECHSILGGLGMPVHYYSAKQRSSGKRASFQMKVSTVLKILKAPEVDVYYTDPETAILRNPFPLLRSGVLESMQKNEQNTAFVISSRDRSKVIRLKNKGEGAWGKLPAEHFPSCQSDFCQVSGQNQGTFPMALEPCEDWPPEQKVGFLRNHTRWLLASAAAGAPPQCLSLAATPRHPFGSRQEGPGYAMPQFVIKVLAFARPKSLRRLLDSLTSADYGGESIPLEIHVDGVGPAHSEETVQDWREVRRVVDLFQWSHGQKRVVLRDKNLGLAQQWLSCWESPSLDEVAMIIEDDCEVAPQYYSFYKAIMQKYFLSFDERLWRVYGIQLKRQHKTANGRPYVGEFLGEQDWFLSQNLITWGPIVFPRPWKEFLEWVRNKRLDPSFLPLVKDLASNRYLNKHDKFKSVWSTWFIRFMMERGFYALATQVPKLIVAHQEAGVHTKKQADTYFSEWSETHFSQPSGKSPSDLPPLEMLPSIDPFGGFILGNPTCIENTPALCPHWRPEKTTEKLVAA